MVRPIARKKLRNPKLKTTRRKADKAHKINYKGHPLIRDQWDRLLTVTENYKKLGLVSKLNKVTGGVAFDINASKSADKEGSDEESEEKKLKKAIPKGYGVIERDEEGNIVNIVMGDEEQNPLDSDYEVEGVEAKGEGAKILESFVNSHEDRRERWMSQGSRQAMQAFVDAHGDDYEAMFWDHKLNYLQMTKKQIEKKVKKHLEELAKEGF
ncbi:Nucleolar protein 16 [Coemansia sp. Benny D115]|nr:Nucleolar protein 16 [Coemansia sp. Benny D115]